MNTPDPHKVSPRVSAYLMRSRGVRRLRRRRREQELLQLLRQLATFTQGNAPLVPGLNACVAEAAVPLPALSPPNYVGRYLKYAIILVLVTIDALALSQLIASRHYDEDVVYLVAGVLPLNLAFVGFLLLRWLRGGANRLIARGVIANEPPNAYAPAPPRTGGSRILAIIGTTLLLALYNAAIVAAAALWQYPLAIGLAILELCFLAVGLLGMLPGLASALRMRIDLSLHREVIPTGNLANIMALRERLRNGQQLSEAMAGMHRLFPPDVAGRVRAAEASGRVAICLRDLYEEMTAKTKAEHKFAAQRIYLFLVVVLSLILMAFLLIKVTPVFTEMTGDLPPHMRLIMKGGDFIAYRWPDLVMGFSLVTIVGLLCTRRIKLTQRLIAHVTLRLPVLGPALRFRHAAHATRVLHELTRAGLPLPKVLRTTSCAGLSPVFADAFVHWQRQAEAGASLAECASHGGPMPRGFASLVRLGEVGDALPEALAHATTLYEALAQRAEHLVRTLAYPLGLAPVAGLVYLFATAVFSTLSGLSDELFYSL